MKYSTTVTTIVEPYLFSDFDIFLYKMGMLDSLRIKGYSEEKLEKMPLEIQKTTLYKTLAEQIQKEIDNEVIKSVWGGIKNKNEII